MKALSDKTIKETEKQLIKYYQKTMESVVADFEATYNKLFSSFAADVANQMSSIQSAKDMQTYIPIAESYEDFEEFIYTLEEKYNFKLFNCCWMSCEVLSERSY